MTSFFLFAIDTEIYRYIIIVVIVVGTVNMCISTSIMRYIVPIGVNIMLITKL